MAFDWNNPLGLGLFFLFSAGTVTLLALAYWLVSRSLPVNNRRR